MQKWLRNLGGFASLRETGTEGLTKAVKAQRREEVFFLKSVATWRLGVRQNHAG
jgi:hypothetical protein